MRVAGPGGLELKMLFDRRVESPLISTIALLCCQFCPVRRGPAYRTFHVRMLRRSVVE